MITYLIKSIICSGLLLGVYYLFLEREKMHRFNRFYLLVAFIISWIIPLISFTVHLPKAMNVPQNILPTTNIITQDQSPEILMNTDIPKESVNYLPIIFMSIYGVVTLILLIRFIINIYKLRKSIRNNLLRPFDDHTLVFVPGNEVSFSFFKYIFPAESDITNGQMNKEIFLHEMVHVKEKHSIDILFMELAKVFLWFNPFVFLYKKAIQLNHEFIADDFVVKNSNVSNYQNLLLTKIIQTPISQLVSSSNYSITKKRFIMMTKKTNRTKSFLMKIGLIPLLAVLILFFNRKSIAQNTTTAFPSFNLPAGWFNAGSAPKSYDMGIDKGAGQNGNNTATIKSIDKKINGFGTLMQICLADKYLGKRVRMSAYVKTKDVSDWSGLWFRVDQKDSQEPLSFDNMHDGKRDRSIKGTTDWKKYDIVLDVPSNASNLAYGALLSGTGQIWFDKINFEIVDNSIQTTGMHYENTVPKESKNLSFDK